MTLYSFDDPQDPRRKFSWDSQSGLLLVQGRRFDLPAGSQMGKIFTNLLENRAYNPAEGQYSETAHLKVDPAQARLFIFRLLEKRLQIPRENKRYFIRNVRNQGYEWLPEVTRTEPSSHPSERNISSSRPVQAASKVMEPSESYPHSHRLEPPDSSPLFESISKLPESSPLFVDLVNPFVGCDEYLRGFVGRTSVFEKLKTFKAKCASGYFVIEGLPGMGKSALMYRLLKDGADAAYFNQAGTSERRCLRALLAQLIQRYDLPISRIPETADQDGLFLADVLEQVSKRLDPGKTCTILVDALDEMTRTHQGPILYLPKLLPAGVFVILSRYLIEAEFENLPAAKDMKLCRLKHDSQENEADLVQYIVDIQQEIGLANYLQRNTLEFQPFCNELMDQSEGNFMYLVYVLPERMERVYSGSLVQDLPLGLKSYYADHWRRMCPTDLSKEAEHRKGNHYKYQVVYALLATREPADVDRLKTFTKIQDARIILRVLKEWRPFLHKIPKKEQVLYRIYHKSYMDFLQENDKAHNQEWEKTAHRHIGEAGKQFLMDLGDFYFDNEG